MEPVSPKVRIVEVGLRDGLQNEKIEIPVDQRYQLLHLLLKAGLRSIEAGAFVSPKWVPAMAPSEELFLRAQRDLKKGLLPDGTNLSALVPNEKGMEAALRLGVQEIAIFAACSETFSQKNTNCSMDESFHRLKTVVQIAQKQGVKIRGYLSTCFGCPFEGPVSLSVVEQNVSRLLDLGAYEVSLGDTIGLASAGDVERLLNLLLRKNNPSQLAGHFHDTRGQGVANVLRAFQMGLRAFDTSIGGLGGCPYAPGATGNVATEDVVYLFKSLGVETDIDLEKLLDLHRWLSQTMNKELPSKVGIAARHSKNPHQGCFL